VDGCAELLALMCYASSFNVKMVVMDHSSDTYQVDLCHIHGNSQNDDVPVSVRDALVFLQYGCFVAGTKLKVRKVMFSSFGIRNM
jgi:hypothetical protein